MASANTVTHTAELNPDTNENLNTPATSIGNQNITTLDAVGGDLEGHMDSIEREILQNAMTEYRWNKTAAAKALGVSFRSLRYRLKKLGLDD